MKISICGITNEIPEEVIKINEILSPFYKKAYTLSTELYLDLEKEKNVDVFLEKLYETSCTSVDTVVQMAIDHLIKLDIWDYNADRFNDKYEAERYNVNELFEEFYGEEYLDILQEEEKIRSIRAMERSSRSNWVGGGFGFSGAIKGAIQAEILNFATDAVRSINDSSEDEDDKANINKLKKELINDKEKLESYSYSLRIKLQNVGWALYDLLVENGKAEKYTFDMQTAYPRFSNIVDSSLSNGEKASKIIECISIYPYLYDFYEALYDIEPSKTVYDLAVLFGFPQRIQFKFLANFWKDYEPMSKMPGGSPEKINKKYAAFVKLMKQYNFMKADGSWDEEFVQDYDLGDLLKEHKIAYNMLEKDRRTFNNKEYPTFEEAHRKYNEYLEDKRAEKEKEENIEKIKQLFKIGGYLAVIGIIIYVFYSVFVKTGILGAIIDLFNSVGN